MAQVTVKEFHRIMTGEAPWFAGQGMSADSIGAGAAVLRMSAAGAQLRPGGTVSGPSMMALADATMYAVLLGAIGPVKLAVTTSLTINFLHRPRPADLIGEGKILKLGKRLAVMDVHIHSDGFEDPVAHATGTYSIPPRRDGP